MDFTYDDDQESLREAVRGLVGKAYSDFGKRRQAVADEPGYSADLWGKLAEMGLLGLPFSEEDGGSGAGPVEVAIVAEELGRVIAPEPFLSAVVLAGGVVAAAGTDEQRAEVLGALSSGESTVAFAHYEPGRRWSATASDVKASGDGDSWTLEGVKEPVLHGAHADVLVVSAVLPDGGTGLFLVQAADATGLERVSHTTFDGGRSARVTFAGTTATPLGVAGTDQSAAISRALDGARITACAEAVGAMDVALHTTTAYLKSRKQFGVTLNTFQALTFRAADMYVSLELATSMAQWATMVLAQGTDAEIADAARRAGLQVSRSGRHIGQEAIQLHGGIGMTAEYSVGSYTSHLTALDHAFGDGSFHLGALTGAIADHGAIDPLG
ncbi:acyl-CoA dehydrogenase family protein [Lapillicoccus sp.]|uniref:acyl-CoA dehydrogenase family protein n=1 Tax=Lapillicoccus sp. TaxID=1909287 RepID=UPI0025FD4C82|nr:acyl-CoA dehydrogenase family protein [Lapillicoccus sp.]